MFVRSYYVTAALLGALLVLALTACGGGSY